MGVKSEQWQLAHLTHTSSLVCILVCTHVCKVCMGVKTAHTQRCPAMAMVSNLYEQWQICFCYCWVCTCRKHVPINTKQTYGYIYTNNPKQACRRWCCRVSCYCAVNISAGCHSCRLLSMVCHLACCYAMWHMHCSCGLNWLLPPKRLGGKHRRSHGRFAEPIVWKMYVALMRNVNDSTPA